MAVTTVASGNQKAVFENKYFKEYVRETIFSAYMGTDQNSIIQVFEKLGTEKGQTINVPLITRLSNAGISGDSTLEDNEEALGNYNHAITVDQVRNAVRVGTMEQQHTEIDLLEAARIMLKMWSMDDLRDDILAALGSPVVTGDVAYADATEAQKDAWLAANHQSDTNTKMLFGAAVSNEAAGDHSASLATVDSSTDVLDFDMIQLAKRLARKADRHIRPVKVKGGREFFVCFSESFGYRDLKADTETFHQNAGRRGKENQLFQDADLNLDGNLIKEVPEITPLAGVGASAIDVGQHYLCGAQAVGVAWAKRPKMITDTFDYQNQKGVAVAECRGCEKLSWNNIQNGVFTIYASAVADS